MPGLCEWAQQALLPRASVTAGQVSQCLDKQQPPASAGHSIRWRNAAWSPGHGEMPASPVLCSSAVTDASCQYVHVDPRG